MNRGTVKRRTFPEDALDASATSDGTLKFSLRNLLTENSELASLWKEEQLCDVVLQSRDGFRVSSHKIILSSVSPFFRAMFTGAGSAMAENRRRLPTGENVVVLQGVSGEGLQSITQAIYTNTLEISGKNLETVLESSNLLEIPTIRDVCCEYLRWMLSVENCLAVLELAEMYNCYELREDVVQLIELLLMPQLATQIGRLSRQSILQIIQNQDITVESERQILKFALEWIRGEGQNRTPDATEILSRIQLPSSVIEQEISSLGMDPASLLPSATPQPSCHTSQTGGHPRSHTHIFVAGRPKRVSMCEAVGIGGHDASWRTFKTVELYDPTEDAWSSAPSMPNSFPLAGAATMSRSVFVVGGSMYDANVCQYDKRSRQWKRGASLRTPKIHAAVAGVGCAIYVCGGRTGFLRSSVSTEVLLQGDASEWTEGPPMCEPRCCFGAATLHGDLYVVGGQSDRLIYDAVEVLPYGAEQWTVLHASPLTTPRKYLSLCVTAGRFYAIGGMDEHRVRLCSVEALDPREGKWRFVKDMSVSRSSCGAAALREKLYVLGGNAGDDVIHDTMECYVPEADDWFLCSSLNSGRSGLSAVAL